MKSKKKEEKEEVGVVSNAPYLTELGISPVAHVARLDFQTILPVI